MLRKNPDTRPSIDDILADNWLANIDDTTMNTSLLIKSFYMISGEVIKEIDQSLFDKDGLRKFICLLYRNSIQDCLKNLCDIIA